jgi:hypothetical protein
MGRHPVAMEITVGSGYTRWHWGHPVAVGTPCGSGDTRWQWGHPVAVETPGGSGDTQWQWGHRVAVYWARLSCWISPCYGPFSLGGCFETYEPFIYLIFEFFPGPR